MGKVDRFRNTCRAEPFSVLFWALGIVLYVYTSQNLTLPAGAGPATMHRCTQSMAFYKVVIVGSIPNEGA